MQDLLSHHVTLPQLALTHLESPKQKETETADYAIGFKSLCRFYTNPGRMACVQPKERDFMSPDTFGQSVLAAGCNEPVIIKREPNGFVDVHQHPFEAKALILDGQIEIGFETTACTYRRGDIFHLTNLEPHWERYGPQGVVYLSARKAQETS